MAMPDATPALIDRVEPYWLIEQTRLADARTSADADAAIGRTGPSREAIA